MSVKRDTGRPWAAATAAWLVIHGVAAGMRRESSRNGVERWAAQWRNVSPDLLITYPMQAVHHVYRLPVWNILLKTQNVHIDKDTFYFDI